jgi:RNA polymerase-associated protein LEO1
MDIERDEAPVVNKQKLLEDLFGADSDDEEEFKSEVPLKTSNGNINNKNNNNLEEPNVDALFNDNESLHSDEEEVETTTAITSHAFSTDKKGAQRLTGEESQTTGVTLISSQPVPHIPEDAKLNFVRIKPSIVGLQPAPYDSSTYDGVDQQPELYVEEGFDKIRFKSESVIRWRWSPRSGNDKTDTSLQTKQTNTRLVRWSDGSMHLFVGNTPFEVRDQQISDHRHVFVQQKGYIEMDQKLQRKLNFVPIAVAGKRKRAMLLDAKETKKRSSKLFTRLVNPEDFTQEQARKESLKKGGIKQRRASRGQELNEDYLNDDSDNEGNVGAIKAQYRRVDSKDDEEAVERRILAAKENKARGAVLRNDRKIEKDLAGFVVDDEDESEGSFSDEDSDEDDYRRKKKQKR